MAKNDTTITTRVSQDVVDDVEELAEASNRSKSATTRRMIEEGIDRRELPSETDDEPARGTSPLTVFGVASLATAPTLLASGYTAIGGVAGVVAALYVLLWVTATDHLVEDAIASARDQLREVGGVTGLFRSVMFEDRAVDEPETLVERLTYADVAGGVLLSALVVVTLPLVGAAYFGVLEPFLATVGSLGALAILAVVLLLAYGGALLIGVSAVATLAVGTARHGTSVDDATDA